MIIGQDPTLLSKKIQESSKTHVETFLRGFWALTSLKMLMTNPDRVWELIRRWAERYFKGRVPVPFRYRKKNMFFFRLSEKIRCWFIHFQMELEVHTWWFCSTIEYYKTTEYELLTPPRSAWTRISIFKRISILCEKRKYNRHTSFKGPFTQWTNKPFYPSQSLSFWKPLDMKHFRSSPDSRKPFWNCSL